MGRKEYAMLFVKDKRMQATLKGTIEDNWKQTADLMSDCDFMVVDSIDGKPLDPRAVTQLLKLIIEGLSDLGYPLIWKAYRGSLFVALDRESGPHSELNQEQWSAFVETESTVKYTQPKNHLNFDFYGFLTKDAVASGKPLEYEPSLESLIDRAAKTPDGGLLYAQHVKRWIAALAPVVAQGPTFRDRDLEHLVETLYKELAIVTGVSVPEAAKIFGQNGMLPIDYAQTAETLRQHREATLPMPPLTTLVGGLQRRATIDAEHEWIRRCVSKVTNCKEVTDEDAVNEIVGHLLGVLEGTSCIWCGTKDVDPATHYAECKPRKRALFPDTSSPQASQVEGRI